MGRRLLSCKRGESQTMRWCARSTCTAWSACSHAHLEGFALDDERCFCGCDEALFNGLVHRSKQLRVFMTATGRINATKGMVVRVDHLVFHQDEKGMVWLAHLECSFNHLLSHCAKSNDDV